MRKLVQFAALLALIHCAREAQNTGGRSAGVGTALLKTEYRRDAKAKPEYALVHVLFVPEVDAPKGGFGFGGSSGGTAERSVMTITFHDDAAGLSIQSRPVTIIDGKVLEAGGRLFDLERGNVFVARVRRDGSLGVRQMPNLIRHNRKEPPNSIVSAIRAMTPDDARVQALP